MAPGRDQPASRHRGAPRWRERWHISSWHQRNQRVIAPKDGILAPTGALQFDTLRLHDSMTDAYSQEVSLAFPTGSFRAPPSDSIARTSDILAGVKTNRSATAAAAGFSYTRTDLQWANVEAKPGVYDWAAHDRIVQEAQTRGIATLFVLGLGAPRLYGWSRRAPCSSSTPLRDTCGRRPGTSRGSEWRSRFGTNPTTSPSAAERRPLRNMAHCCAAGSPPSAVSTRMRRSSRRG